MHKKLLLLKFIVLAALLLSSIGWSIYMFQQGHDWTYILNHIQSFGMYTMLAILLITIITTTLGLPIMISLFLAAFTLSYVAALITILIGATLGSIGGFYIARFLGREYVERKFVSHIQKLKRFDTNLSEHGFWTTFALRLIPVLPFEVVNIIGGISRMRLRDYISATFLGIIPGTAILIYMLRSFNMPNFVAMSLVVGLFSLFLLFSKQVRSFVFG